MYCWIQWSSTSSKYVHSYIIIFQTNNLACHFVSIRNKELITKSSLKLTHLDWAPPRRKLLPDRCIHLGKASLITAKYLVIREIRPSDKRFSILDPLGSSRHLDSLRSVLWSKSSSSRYSSSLELKAVLTFSGINSHNLVYGTCIVPNRKIGGDAFILHK